MCRSVRFPARKAAVYLSVLFTLCFYGCRKSGPKSSPEYAAEIKSRVTDLQAEEGERIPVRISLTNIGRSAWDSQTAPPCFLSYHLLDRDHTVIRFDNRRITLPGRIEPGDTAQIDLDLRAPLQKGTYILEFDLVREGAAWFKDYGSDTYVIRLEVSEKIWADSQGQIGLEYSRSTRFSSSVPQIDQIYKLIRITLEENQTEFKGMSGRVQGFAPGKDYPQIWLRDASTIVSASRYFYEAPWMSSWLEEHLHLQEDNGSLWDWINSQGEFSKNTTETDQEASAVQAAYQIYPLLGEPWLHKKIDGRSIITRLEAALQYVLDHRRDRNTGLISGAHTADWGDVDFVDVDELSVSVDERTRWTVDIYDQSMVYDACLKLSRMLRFLGEDSRAQKWEETASALRTRSQQLLWQEDRGFFAVHHHLDDLEHDFDEDDIFAMGGNVQALLSGMADPLQARRIIRAGLDRQSMYGLSTVSGTLLPPYPQGAFAHPMMDDPFEYQNGGQWDWFGGRFVFAMFETGYAHQAREKLIEIFEKNLLNRGFFEWDNREGVGAGSDIFCGSAGSLSQALLSGYFGIHMDASAPRVEPKLGWDSGRIHLFQPGNDTFIAYHYVSNALKKELELRINSNISHIGTVKILVPDQAHPAKEDRDIPLQVRLDGKTIPYKIETRGADTYVVMDISLKNRIIHLVFQDPIAKTPH